MQDLSNDLLSSYLADQEQRLTEEDMSILNMDRDTGHNFGPTNDYYGYIFTQVMLLYYLELILCIECSTTWYL